MSVPLCLSLHNILSHLLHSHSLAGRVIVSRVCCRFVKATTSAYSVIFSPNMYVDWGLAVWWNYSLSLSLSSSLSKTHLVQEYKLTLAHLTRHSVFWIDPTPALSLLEIVCVQTLVRCLSSSASINSSQYSFGYSHFPFHFSSKSNLHLIAPNSFIKLSLAS